MREVLKQIFNENRNTDKGGIFCVCSAHPDVVVASLRYAKKNNTLLSIETTAHQVNHDGGYTGVTPKEYIDWVKKEAKVIGLAESDYILGGDHLGPTSWKNLSADQAMQHSKKVVEEYVKAGYYKIHLDTSILCADDSVDTPESVLIERTITLAKIAEETAKKNFGSSEHLFYIVGTEVPLPGGSQKTENTISCTSKEQAQNTLELTKKAFLANGLESAWNRVYGLVLQPGVEFGDDFVFVYKKGLAKQLIPLLDRYPNMIYEAHSTDYQTGLALKSLVQDHFAILKVGPWLTNAWKEALFSLDIIEQELPQFTKKSYVKKSLEKSMKDNNTYWKVYYMGTAQEINYKIDFSLSDRSRYYWEVEEVKGAIFQLLNNLDTIKGGIPYAMLSQYIPWALDYQEIHNVVLTAQEILYLAVERILQKYDNACNKC